MVERAIEQYDGSVEIELQDNKDNKIKKRSWLGY